MAVEETLDELNAANFSMDRVMVHLKSYHELQKRVILQTDLRQDNLQLRNHIA